MKSLQLGKAFQLTMRTAPILLIRLGANLLFWLAALIYLAIAAGIAYLIGQAVEILGVIIFVVALVAVAPIYYLVQRYVLYILKAAQIAVVAEVLTHGDLPEGTNQLQWGKDRVQERFGEASAMFVVDEIVSAVVRTITNTIEWLTRWLPGDALQTLIELIKRVIEFSLSYIDEAILARTFWRGGTVINNAKEGVVLYAQVWKPLLLNAVALMVISYLPFLIAFLIFAAPVGLLTSVFSETLAGWSIIITLILAFLIKVAVGDSFAMIAMIAAYQRETAELQPDAEMVAKLEGVSDKFRNLEDEIRERVGKLGEEQKEKVLSEQPE